MSDAASLLIVEDDDALRERLARAFDAARSRRARRAAQRDDAERLAREDPPELVRRSTCASADESGLDLIRDAARRSIRRTRIVVLTGYGSIATAVEAVRRGAHALPDQAGRRRRDPRGVRPRAGRRERRRRRCSRCRSIASSGSTSTACCSTAAATSPKPRARLAFTAARCSASWRSIRRDAEAQVGCALHSSLPLRAFLYRKLVR